MIAEKGCGKRVQTQCAMPSSGDPGNSFLPVPTMRPDLITVIRPFYNNVPKLRSYHNNIFSPNNDVQVNQISDSAYLPCNLLITYDDGVGCDYFHIIFVIHIPLFA